MNIGVVFKYYWPHIKRYKKSVALVFLSYGLAVAGSSIISPVLYKQIIDIASGSTNPAETFPTFFNIFIFLGIVLFSYNIFYRVADYAMAWCQSQMIKDIVDDAFLRVQRHSYEFFSGTFTGSLVAKVRRYARSFEQICDQIVFSAWMNGLQLIFGLIVLTYFSLVLGAIFLVWIIIYLAVTFIFVRKKFEKDLQEAEADSKTTGALADVVTNMLNVKMFASQEREFSNFAQMTRIEENKRRIAWNFQNLQFMFQGYFIAAFEFIGMFTVIYLWSKGVVSTGTIVLAQIYIFASFDVVWNVGRNFTRTMRAFAEAKEMVDIFEKLVSVKDPENPQRRKIGKGEIQIKNVSFSYKEGRKVFDNFSLRITPGEKVGLVGHSGAGKTTITKLLLRFVDVQKGGVFIDGQDISKITQNDLRSKIAYVPQDPILFHRTIKENIAYSRPEASEEEIINAAKKSHAHDFIMRFPNGYDTYVGERGIKISGGERQRVAIARAMLKNAPILILDEATSSLDSISEKHIQDAFDEIMKGRTTIVIAHRLSTIQKMDRVVVFDKGKIAEEGTHGNLIAKKGLYYKLWKHQSRGFV